jgi:Flp pilus assembly protein TadB
MELTVKQTAVVTGIFLVGILVVWIKFKRSYLGRSDRNRSLRDIGRYLDESEQEEDVDLEGDNPASEGKKKGKKNKEPSVEELLIMAGRMSAIERDHFHRRKRLAPVVFGFAGLVIGLISGDINTALMTLTIGALVGLSVPMMVLRGWVKKQHAELSYYLPLLIEQISIGVSSSLDIGPCISQLVQMADDRQRSDQTFKACAVVC